VAQLDSALASGAKDEKSQPTQNQGLSDNPKIRSAVCSTFSEQKNVENDTELQQVIAAWSELPEHIKQAIKALIRTNKNSK